MTKEFQSILDVDAWCDKCGWTGIVGECIPDVDSDGNLGCPECYAIVKTDS